MSKNDAALGKLKLVAKIPKDKPYYRLDGLTPSTGYYVTVTATNEHGEGYKPEQPQLIMT